MDVKPQVILLLVSLALGVFTGLLFDLYRRVRNLISPGLILTALGDLCFWFIITIITFSSLLKINFGAVRGYAFLSITIGLIFYLITISNHIIYALVVLELFIKNLIYKISLAIGKVKKLKIIAVPKRIIQDARRIFGKLKKR